MSAVKLDQLRAAIAHLEAPAAGRAAPAPLGVADLDAALGGGLARGALHEICAAGGDAPASFGFALALAALLAPAGLPILHVTLPHVEGEWGRVYGPGLGAFGLDPGRFLFVAAERPADALWACEEALGCAGLGAVILEIAGNPAALDLTASRRLSLRAARSGVAALLVRPGEAAAMSAAATRWRVGPAAGRDAPSFVFPRPAWRARLERNRAGAGGVWSLSWRPDVRALASDAPLPVAAPAAPADRAAPAGERRRH